MGVLDDPEKQALYLIEHYRSKAKALDFATWVLENLAVKKETIVYWERILAILKSK